MFWQNPFHGSICSGNYTTWFEQESGAVSRSPRPSPPPSTRGQKVSFLGDLRLTFTLHLILDDSGSRVGLFMAIGSS